MTKLFAYFMFTLAVILLILFNIVGGAKLGWTLIIFAVIFLAMLKGAYDCNKGGR